MLRPEEEICWSFYGYVTPAGGEEVQEWFDALMEEEKDGARDTLGYLQRLPLRLWNKPEYELLGDGLSEIRFKVSALNKTYRIYGCFWPQGKRYSYTLLLGKEKKVKNDDRGKEEARRRQRGLIRGEATTHAFKFSS